MSQPLMPGVWLAGASGDYHVELVANGTDTVTLFLFDVNDKPVESAGFTANAILIVNKKPARFTIDPSSGQQLVGKAPGPVVRGVRGAFQVILPAGATAQVKFRVHVAGRAGFESSANIIPINQ